MDTNESKAQQQRKHAEIFRKILKETKQIVNEKVNKRKEKEKSY